MELRHLRYFVAVGEEGSLTVAAERRLHSAQPSLSRQMRDLEYEVGAQFMVRSARGGCTSVANINCVILQPPVPTSDPAIIAQSDKWQGLRLGMAGEMMVTDRERRGCLFAVCHLQPR
jgi:Bacterial regulatory helix-turn-helix protein, lysR family